MALFRGELQGVLRSILTALALEAAERGEPIGYFSATAEPRGMG
jgi:hypothetical protein